MIKIMTLIFIMQANGKKNALQLFKSAGLLRKGTSK